MLGLQKLLRRLFPGRPEKIMYIGGSDILPPPLTGEEEQTVLERLDAGGPEAKSSWPPMPPDALRMKF